MLVHCPSCDLFFPENLEGQCPRCGWTEFKEAHNG